MPDDEVAALTESLASHREMLIGAIRINPELDLERALEVHAGLGDVMSRWTHFTAEQQREIVRTIEYLINDEDSVPDLRTPDGFRDDLAQFHQLQAFLS